MRVLSIVVLWLCLASASGLAADFAASAETVTPLAVGARAPSVELRDVDGGLVLLDRYVGSEPVALVFYRGGW